MADTLPRYTLRINPVLLDKIGYIADYNGRSKNREIERLIRQCIQNFEAQHGAIELKKQDE